MHDRYILLGHSNVTIMNCSKNNQQQIDYGIYFEMKCRYMLNNCPISDDHETNDYENEISIEPISIHTSEEYDTLTSDLSPTTTISTTKEETKSTFLPTQAVTTANIITDSFLSSQTIEMSSTAVVQEDSNAKKGLILGLIISLIVVVLILIGLSIFTIILLRRFLKLKNFKSDVAYEITNFDSHLAAEYKSV